MAVFDPLFNSVTLQWAIVVFIGLALGSFATALSGRVPDRKNIATRSFCPSCGHHLAPLDLFPVLSWAFLRGQCRYCAASIGWKYPLIELSVLVACGLAYWRFGMTMETGFLILLSPVLVSLISIDLQKMLLPNPLVSVVALLGLAHIALEADMAVTRVLSGAGFLAVGLAIKIGFEAVLKKPAFGMGDVKFMGAAGLWFAFGALPFYLAVSCGIGIALALFMRVKYKSQYAPFGPGLCAGFFILLLLRGTEWAVVFNLY